MSLGKKRGAIEKWSGGVLMVKEVNADGSDLSSPDSFSELSYVKSAKYQSSQAKEKVQDETGNTVATLFNEREAMITGNFLQSDKDLQDFLESTVADKYYAVYAYRGIVNGNYQELYCPICQFTPMYEDEPGTRQPAFEIEVLKNEAAITIDYADLPSGHHGATSTDVVIAAGAYRQVVETAVT